MFETLSISLLTNAKLAPDWMTLFVGCQGIELMPYYTAEVPFDDVQRFAIDQLALVAGTPEEWDVFRIADAESLRHGAEIIDVFHGLAKRNGVSADCALRKWRYAVIQQKLLRLEEEAACGRPSHDTWVSHGDHLYDLVSEWGTICSENPHRILG